MYPDPSDLFDSLLAAQDEQNENDPCFLEALPGFNEGFLPKALQAMVERYEKRLGRKLNQNEGQVLWHAMCHPNPTEALPRFTKCPCCRGTVDNGPLKERYSPMAYGGLPLCPECDDIPF